MSPSHLPPPLGSKRGPCTDGGRMGRDAAAGRSTGRGDRGYEWVKRKDFSPPLCPHSRPEGLWNLTAVVRHKALACCPLHVPSPSPSSWAVSPHPETKMVIFFFFRASFSPNLWRCWELLFPWKPSRQPCGGGVGQPPPPLRLRSLSSLRSLVLARGGPKLRIIPSPHPQRGLQSEQGERWCVWLWPGLGPVPSRPGA